MKIIFMGTPHYAGVVLNKKLGDCADVDETIMTLYYNNIQKEKLEDSINYANKSIEIS